MPEANNAAAIPNPVDTAVKDPSLLAEAGAAADKTVLSEAAEQEKQAQAAEETRLLEADVNTLSETEKTKRIDVEKVREEKRLLDAKPEDLSKEDKEKRDVLVKAKEEADKAKVVPEKYEFKMPEGITLDQAFVDKVTPIFKKHGITQAAAQEIADLYIANTKAAADAQEAGFKKHLKDSYDETIKALGANHKEELSYVAKVRDAYFSEETREMLDASGISNNKAFILDLVKLGKLISEDKLVHGKAAAPGELSKAERVYGKK